MDCEDDFNRFRYRTRVQAVAVIDILVGTIPFIRLAFDFNDKDLADLYQDREYLVLIWSVLLCVYVLQLIMGIWLLAATREVYSEYTVGNCQVWFHVALFSFVFYMGEMAVDISSIVETPSSRTIKQVFVTMSFHAAKIIYRAATLMIVNNFLYDVCRPVYRYLSQGSYQYKYYYQSRFGIPLLPTRRTSIAATAAFPAQRQPNYRYYTTYPQPRNKLPPNAPRPHQPPQPLQHPRLIANSINHHPYPYANCNNIRSSANNSYVRTNLNLTNHYVRTNMGNNYVQNNTSNRVLRRPVINNAVAGRIWNPDPVPIPAQ